MCLKNWIISLVCVLFIGSLLTGCANQQITPLIDSIGEESADSASEEDADPASAEDADPVSAEDTDQKLSPSATLAPPVPTRTPIPSYTPIPTIVFPELSGEYLGQPLPGLTPELFAPGIVSIKMNNRDLTFSPDGTQLFYCIGGTFSVILWMRQVDGIWTEPEIAPFSGEYTDIDPAFTPDGEKLFFASLRPLEKGSEADGKYRLFYVERQGNGWSDPKPVGEAVNQGDSLISPSVAEDGTLYFAVMHPQEYDWEIYRSRLVNDEYQEPENLGEPVNTGSIEFNPHIAPDQSYLLFTDFGEIEISWQQADGTWSEPENLTFTLNLSSVAWGASVSPDGKVIFLIHDVSPRPMLPLYPPGFDLISDVISTASRIESLGRSEPNWEEYFDVSWVSSDVLPDPEDE